MGQGAGPAFPVGGGEVGAWVRAHDWTATPLGPVEQWPPALRVAVSLMLDSPESMYLAWGPDLVFFFNDAYRPILGPRLPRALGARLPELWSDAWEQVRPMAERALAGEACRFDDLPVTMARYGVEEDTWWSFSYSPIRDEAGRVMGLFCITNETTERVRSVAALRASEARNRQILDSAIDYAIVATDLDGRVTGWNKGAHRVLGWTEAEMLGQPLARFFTPEDVAAGQAQKEMRSALERHRGVDERWHQRKGGERFWASGEMTALKEADGMAVGFVKVLRDRTEQRLVAEAGRRNQIRLAAALDIARLGTFEWDVTTGLVDLSRRSREIFGLPEDGTITQEDVFGRIAPSDIDRIFDESQQAVAAAQQLETDYEIILPDGSSRTVHSLGNLLGGEAGGRPRMFGVFSDITDRKRAEAALVEMNETLERRVAQALAEREVVEEALRQSQKMEAVGQLTGGLAHDFNNLLTGISGSLELLQARVSQGRIGEVDRYVTAAQGAAKRAAALTHRLLAFSRRQTLDPKPTDVNRLMAGMQELIERTTGPEVAVEPIAGVGLWATLVDPGQLENALLNLCINARDAMPDGGKLTIETANCCLDDRTARGRDLPPGQYVSLCVSDNGTGMAPDVIARAFDPFFTTKPIGQGTGLGLSMVYGFARQSGGQVRIHSEVGQGTTVCLFLPRHAGEAEAADVPAELSDAPRAGHGETVLVVDDEPTVRMLVTEVLEDLGYTAIEAADGAAGLRVLQSDARIDLLVTDVGLPGGMNGRQVADAARVARPGLKVLFITGYAENAVLSHGHLDPGMHVLIKPFAMESLASRIKELIAGGQGAGESA